MNKKLIKLTESDLHRIVKESVNKVLCEGGEPYLKELCKTINYHYSEAMQNLQDLLKVYEQLPEEYSNMKASNMAMVRKSIEDLGLTYKGKNWQEDFEKVGRLRQGLHNGDVIGGIG